MTKVTIDRELLERLETWVTDDCEALHELQAILAASSKPDGNGLEVVAYECLSGFHVSLSYEPFGDNPVPLWRAPDAQRTIAELRGERDTLRQQLAERDADAERWRYTQHPDYICCGPYDTDGDYCGYSVGVLKYANGKQLSLNHCIEGRGDSLGEAIDAALAEVTSKK